MPVVGINNQEVYVDELRRVLRLAGVFMPLLVISYGLAVRYGLLNSEYYAGDDVFIGISAVFLVMGIWQYFAKRPDRAIQVIGTLLYHAIVASFILFISGMSSPVVLIWIALVIASDLYLGKGAAYLSIAGLFLVASVHFLLNPQQSLTALSETVISVLVITGASYLVLRLRSVNVSERKALLHTRKQEELQRDRLMTLINSMGDAVVSTDSNGDIRLYNAALLNLIDTNESLTGKNISKILHLIDKKGDPVDAKQLLLSVKSPTTMTDLIHKYSEEERAHFSISMAPIRPTDKESSQFGYILVMRDITKEKSLEEERDEFISVVSHELRTPIAIAEGNISNVQVLMKRGLDQKSLESSLESAHEQIMFLAKMINDLSALSRAERGAGDTEEDIDVDAMLHGMYDEYHSRVAEKGLVMNLDIIGKIGMVHASRLYLEEVLQNFITNAMKYTKEGSVTLAASVEDGEVLFSVKDTGIGISKTDQSKIFDKFYRSEDYRTRETKGTGLGLYVVRKLAAKLKTQIEVESRLNYGSKFSFRIPLLKDSES